MQEKLGCAADHLGTQELKQVVGDAQKVYGQSKGAAHDTAMSLDQWFRRTIETQPFATVLVVLGIGTAGVSAAVNRRDDRAQKLTTKSAAVGAD